MKECPFCRGSIEERQIEHPHRWGGRLYILRNVRAEVCTQCGETFFSPNTLEAMDRIVEGNNAPSEYVSVPVFSL